MVFADWLKKIIVGSKMGIFRKIVFAPPKNNDLVNDTFAAAVPARRLRVSLRLADVPVLFAETVGSAKGST